ncbi:MAG: gliding motility-associated ABC transporter ATP-binding subunit GldA [Bacteroidia bacterium]|nr:gliding motility-associated ABC transporter ATP-binding subunit GldA [Bacteroidia bacterium]
MSIEVSRISKQYGSQWAVNDLSFEIPSGQVVGFLGPNGAGKSTTMKMLTCYITPTSGTARVGGLSIETDSLKIRQQIGYLPEHNPLYYDMYVKEYLRFIADLCGIRKGTGKRVDHMVELTGLTREASKKIGSLSKGYKQRVGMAQALMSDPKVLILDEPTSGLDPNQITEIRKLIKEIGQERTVLLSTHIMQEVEAMCNRVIIINKGELAADDSIGNLQTKHNSQRVFVVKFKNPVNVIDLKKVEGIEALEDLNDNTFRLVSDKAVDAQEKLFNFAVNSGNIILEQKEEAQNLEHIFRSITN